jgi:hypothetical protein
MHFVFLVSVAMLGSLDRRGEFSARCHSHHIKEGEEGGVRALTGLM